MNHEGTHLRIERGHNPPQARRRLARRFDAALAGVALLAKVAVGAGCGDDPPRLVLDITTGHEKDTFTADPPVTEVEIVGRSPGGTPLVAATTTPGGAFVLGDLPPDQLLSFEVDGRDPTGTSRVRGRTLGVVVGGLTSDTLGVFVQRAGTWSRPPGALPRSLAGGRATMLGERFLLLTGGEPAGEGTATQALYYDLLSLGGTAGGELPRVPESLVAVGGAALLLIDGEGASWVDFDTGTVGEVTVPEGLDGFAEIAGGVTVQAAAGVQYVVGGTRDGEPTAAVLRVGADGALSRAEGVAARAGAAATYVEGIGLVIAGGDDAAPGVEVLADGAPKASVRAYEPDATTGAAAIARDDGTSVLLLGGRRTGGDAPTRLVDLGCVNACEATDLQIPLPYPLSGVEAFMAGSTEVVLVGRCDDGFTCAVTVDPTSGTAASLPLREPRIGAAVTVTPTGTLALLGGRDERGAPRLTVELFLPATKPPL